MGRKWLKWRFFEQILAFRSILGYAYTAQIKKRGNFGMRESMKREERGNFPEKKFQKAWGKRPEIFQKKFFSEISKFCATSVAPRAAGL